MSIESKIPIGELNVKDLNLERPEQDEVFFDEKKILSEPVWQKLKMKAQIELDKALHETDPRKREMDLRSHYGLLMSYNVLTEGQKDDMPTDQAVTEAHDAHFQKALAGENWAKVAESLADYLMSRPEKLKEVQLTEEQYKNFVERIQNKYKQAGETQGNWIDYLVGVLVLKHLYPEDPGKWVEIPPETMQKIQTSIDTGGEEFKVLYKVLLPERAGEIKVSKEQKLRYYKELLEAKQKELWHKYGEVAVNLKIAEAEAINYTPKGIEVKLPAFGIKDKTSALPETKKF